MDIDDLLGLQEVVDKKDLTYNEKWRWKNREFMKFYMRKRHLKSFGLSHASYEEMLKSQNGVCAICKHANKIGEVLCIDHDHKTGYVRGLLCNRCNRGIGCLGDDVEMMLRVIEYFHKAIDKQVKSLEEK